MDRCESEMIEPPRSAAPQEFSMGVLILRLIVIALSIGAISCGQQCIGPNLPPDLKSYIERQGPPRRIYIRAPNLKVAYPGYAVGKASVPSTWMEKGMLYNGNAPWAWNWPGSTIDGDDWNVEQTEYRMIPRLDIIYEQRLQRVDTSGSNDSLSPGNDVKGVKVGYRWSGHFKKVRD